MSGTQQICLQNWRVRSLDSLGKVISGATPSTKVPEFWNGDIAWITPADLSQQLTPFINATERSISLKGLESCAASLIPKHNLVISSRAPIGYVAIPTMDFATNQGCKSLHLNPEQDYLFHYYNLCFHVRKLKEKGEGTTFAEISKTVLASVQLTVPDSFVVQSAIGQILIAVDTAIAALRALIAKHDRVKIGLLQDLLTRGVDREGRLRDPIKSTFKTTPLGRVPHEWRVSDLGSVASKITSGSRGWAAYYANEGALFLRVGNLTRRHVNLRWTDTKFVKPPSGSEGKRSAVQAGDLVISITADLGMIGVVPEGLGEAYVNQHIALVRLKRDEVNPWFLANLLASHSGQRQFAQANESGAKAGLNLPSVAAIPIVLPEIDEQNEIAKIIKRVEDIVVAEETRLEKLIRIKSGLMADLLTNTVSVESLHATVGQT
jgi:type I restriction enzyme, S subunit